MRPIRSALIPIAVAAIPKDPQKRLIVTNIVSLIVKLNAVEIRGTMITIGKQYVIHTDNNLDKYKYPNRFSGVDQYLCRDKNLFFLEKLNSYLEKNKSLNFRKIWND